MALLQLVHRNSQFPTEIDENLQSPRMSVKRIGWFQSLL
jgi:hypothetical protein